MFRQNQKRADKKKNIMKQLETTKQGAKLICVQTMGLNEMIMVFWTVINRIRLKNKQLLKGMIKTNKLSIKFNKLEVYPIRVRLQLTKPFLKIQKLTPIQKIIQKVSTQTAINNLKSLPITTIKSHIYRAVGNKTL